MICHYLSPEVIIIGKRCILLIKVLLQPYFFQPLATWIHCSYLGLPTLHSTYKWKPRIGPWLFNFVIHLPMLSCISVLHYIHPQIVLHYQQTLEFYLLIIKNELIAVWFTAFSSYYAFIWGH